MNSMDRRYQAHPVARDEAYELEPDNARRDVAAAMVAILTLLVLALLGSVVPHP